MDISERLNARRKRDDSGRAVFALYMMLVTYAAFAVLVTIPAGSFWLDEGIYAYTARELMAGRPLYTGIHWPYGPLIPALYVATFRIAGGIEFLYVRWFGLATICISATVLYFITWTLTNRRWLSLFTPALLIGTLGFAQGCRLSASTVAVLWTVLALLIHISDIRRSHPAKLLALGIVLGLAFLTKHNVAAIDCMVHGAFLLWRYRTNWRQCTVPFGFGIATILGAWLCGSSLLDFLRYGFFLQVNGRYVEVMGVPMPSPWNAPIFYAPLLMLTGLVIAWGRLGLVGLRRQPAILLAIAVVLIHLCELYPMADYSHLIRAAAPTALLAPLTLGFRHNGHIRLVVALGLVLSGIWLQLQPAIIEQAAAIRHPGTPSQLPYCTGLYVQARERELLELNAFLNSRPERIILVAGYECVIYLLSGKSAPVPNFDTTALTLSSSEAQSKLVDALAGVDLIVKCPTIHEHPLVDTSRLPDVWRAINRYFRPTVDVADYTIYTRKTE